VGHEGLAEFLVEKFFTTPVFPPAPEVVLERQRQYGTFIRTWSISDYKKQVIPVLKKYSGQRRANEFSEYLESFDSKVLTRAWMHARATYLRRHTRHGYRSQYLIAANRQEAELAANLTRTLSEIQRLPDEAAKKDQRRKDIEKLRDLRLWDLPLWPVDERNRIQTDLLKSWISFKTKTPPPAWSNAVLKSLAQITGLANPPALPRQLGLFDSEPSQGRSLGAEKEGREAARRILEYPEKLNLVYFLETVTTARVKGQLKFTGRTGELIQPLIRSLENSAHQVIFVSDDLAKLQGFAQALNGLALPKNVRNRILVTSGSLKTQKDFLKFQKLEGKTAFVAPRGALNQVVNFSGSQKTNWEIFVAQDELEGGSYGELAPEKLKLKDAYLFSFALSELAKEGKPRKEIQYPSFSFFLSEAIQAWLEGFLAAEAVAKAA
jgi:hypothetical protein